MDVLVLSWNLKQFENIDVFLENDLSINSHSHLLNIFQNCRKASINWSIRKYLTDLIDTKSHPVALSILGDLKR